MILLFRIIVFIFPKLRKNKFYSQAVYHSAILSSSIIAFRALVESCLKLILQKAELKSLFVLLYLFFQVRKNKFNSPTVWNSLINF